MRTVIVYLLVVKGILAWDLFDTPFDGQVVLAGGGNKSESPVDREDGVTVLPSQDTAEGSGLVDDEP